jgi:hypothetical protein
VLALGIGLDDSDVLRTNPFSAAFVQAVEPEASRKQRLAVLGNPTLRGRRDLCQHFAVSAALADLVGGTIAEQVGLAKEQADMLKTSGFSFTDLCADFAGVEFAKHIRAKPGALATLKDQFKVIDYMPDPDGLRDGLSAEKFRRDFGGVDHEKFDKALKDIRERITGLKAYSAK